jgi:hypothetical protein
MYSANKECDAGGKLRACRAPNILHKEPKRPKDASQTPARGQDSEKRQRIYSAEAGISFDLLSNSGNQATTLESTPNKLSHIRQLALRQWC